MPNVTLKVSPQARDELERFKLQIAGLLQRSVNQPQALEILVKLGRNHIDEALEIAEEICGVNK